MRPELLAPAGSFEKMKYAFAYGADACYAGLPAVSLRARENSFTMESLAKATDYAHEHGKKIFFTANILSHNNKIKYFTNQLDTWAAMKPDALIMSDPGLMSIVREKHPEIPLHLSVQANATNWKSIEFWHKALGIERVILSRELKLTEIQEIHERLPEVELEAFIHGSICIAYSGRCLLTSYFNNRDANQGTCDNSCRYNYKIHTDQKPPSNQNHETKPDEDQPRFFLEEERHPGQYYPVDEDEHGTYIMNAKDLRMIEYLKEMANAGVCSFKIEGRSKSLYYVAVVSSAYKSALDDIASGNNVQDKDIQALDKVANRGYHTGFLMGRMGHKSQSYDVGLSANYTHRFGGIVQGLNSKNGRLRVEVRNKIQKGSELEILSPNRAPYSFTVEDILNEHGASMESAHGGKDLVEFPVDYRPEEFSLIAIKEPTQTPIEHGS